MFISCRSQWPLGMPVEELQRRPPTRGLPPSYRKGPEGKLHDGVFDDKTCAALLSLIENAGELQTAHGLIRGVRGKAFQDVLGSAKTPLQVRRGSAEQSNTSILYGDRSSSSCFAVWKLD
jgi:hypothetical protein